MKVDKDGGKEIAKGEKKLSEKKAEIEYNLEK
jgi:hypothetical protein